mmetsp:Transcript_10929/g.23565  ORF Transcript_10929/g.23565 Transcript_10929/m.23565 type:complete len:623 (-) Transcript_10929:1624-3492(-)
MASVEFEARKAQENVVSWVGPHLVVVRSAKATAKERMEALQALYKDSTPLSDAAHEVLLEFQAKETHQATLNDCDMVSALCRAFESTHVPQALVDDVKGLISVVLELSALSFASATGQWSSCPGTDVSTSRSASLSSLPKINIASPRASPGSHGPQPDHHAVHHVTAAPAARKALDKTHIKAMELLGESTEQSRDTLPAGSHSTSQVPAKLRHSRGSSSGVDSVLCQNPPAAEQHLPTAFTAAATDGGNCVIADDDVSDEEEEEGEQRSGEPSVSVTSSTYYDAELSYEVYNKLGGWDVLSAAVQGMYQRLFNDERTQGFFITANSYEKLMRHMTNFIGCACTGKMIYSPAQLHAMHAHQLERGLNETHVDIMCIHLKDTLESIGAREETIMIATKVLHTYRYLFSRQVVDAVSRRSSVSGTAGPQGGISPRSSHTPAGRRSTSGGGGPDSSGQQHRQNRAGPATSQAPGSGNVIYTSEHSIKRGMPLRKLTRIDSAPTSTIVVPQRGRLHASDDLMLTGTMDADNERSGGTSSRAESCTQGPSSCQDDGLVYLKARRNTVSAEEGAAVERHADLPRAADKLTCSAGADAKEPKAAAASGHASKCPFAAFVSSGTTRPPGHP